MRRRLQIVMAKECLDDPDVGPAFQQMGCKAMAKGMHGDRLTDVCRLDRLLEQARELTGAQIGGLPARKQ
jgi:hypothetical protein